MAEKDGFQSLQYAFAAHLRNPRDVDPPGGIEDRRMAVYRELLFNNIERLLSGTFPVTRRLLAKRRWHAMVQDYFARHRARTPLFPQMPREFLDYLENERQQQADDPPFLLELAHYEWVELAVSNLEEDPDLSAVDRDGDLLAGRPVVSGTAWPLSYQFPVHRIRPEFQPDVPGEQPTFLVVYRDLDDKVGFIEINAVTARLLQRLDDDPGLTGRAALAGIAAELGHPDTDAVVAAGAAILVRLRQHNIVLGTAIGA